MGERAEAVPCDVGSAEAQRAMAAYFAVLADRFEAGFEPKDGGADHDAVAMQPPTGTFLILRRDGEDIGCGGVQRHDDEVGEIKRMWVDASWRGRGFGALLLAALESAASDLGYRAVVLDTNSALTEAVAMYERAGYVAIPRYNDNPYAQRWFRKDCDTT